MDDIGALYLLNPTMDDVGSRWLALVHDEDHGFHRRAIRFRTVYLTDRDENARVQQFKAPEP